MPQQTNLRLEEIFQDDQGNLITKEGTPIKEGEIKTIGRLQTTAIIKHNDKYKEIERNCDIPPGANAYLTSSPNPGTDKIGKTEEGSFILTTYAIRFYRLK